MTDLLLITPPFTQLNTPYPATAYLKGFLNTIDASSFQMDLGIEVILELFTSQRLKEMFALAVKNDSITSENAQRIFALKDEYIHNVEAIIQFLQGKQPSLARQIASETFLPQASRFAQLEDMEWAFGSMGIQDKAKHLATLFLEDISDFIIECIDEYFGFSRYAERLGMSANSFDEIYERLSEPLSYIDNITIDIFSKTVRKQKPKLVCISVPFPGNLFSAFRCAQFLKKSYPEIQIAMGGGFANTELRSIKDVRVFEFFDYICLDDGELPIELIATEALNFEKSEEEPKLFKRTFHIENGEVLYNNFSLRQDYKQADLGTPDYSDLLLDQYISVIEIANPMHSLWSDGRWNKLTMAHGCYWGKCTFCDVSLDYIGNYEPIAAKILVDRMEEIIQQTGESGFHFVDEAAPPALMRALALEILKRKLVVSWWTNIRFEKNFTYDLCRLLKSSGCIAVSGGLEVASDRLLKLIDKGVTVAQVAQVTDNFTNCGIMVHAYLMYGYPTQTIQETIDSLEMVRQLFELGVLQSGFWHQFALTAHSPIGLDPDAYGVIPKYQEIGFANNDIQFEDKTGVDHDQFSYGLKKSLFNYMHGVCFELPLQDWFDFEIPETTVDPGYIEGCLEENQNLITKKSAKLCWIGNMPMIFNENNGKEQKESGLIELRFNDKLGVQDIKLDSTSGNWLLGKLEVLSNKGDVVNFAEFKKDYQAKVGAFDVFWYSSKMDKVREMGLLVL